jgi:hypothetical protein
MTKATHYSSEFQEKRFKIKVILIPEKYHFKNNRNCTSLENSPKHLVYIGIINGKPTKKRDSCLLVETCFSEMNNRNKFLLIVGQ